MDTIKKYRQTTAAAPTSTATATAMAKMTMANREVTGNVVLSVLNQAT